MRKLDPHVSLHIEPGDCSRGPVCYGTVFAKPCLPYESVVSRPGLVRPGSRAHGAGARGTLTARSGWVSTPDLGAVHTPTPHTSGCSLQIDLVKFITQYAYALRSASPWVLRSTKTPLTNLVPSTCLYRNGAH